MDPNTSDLILLDAVKKTEPVYVRHSETYVLKKSIPPEVLAALESMTLPVKYIKVDEALCMILADWLSCRDNLIRYLMTRMTRRSLKLGARGPKPDDLQSAPMLSPWVAVRDMQFGGAILVGLQTGHPTLTGRLINTSRLCGIDPGQAWARTASRWYRLSDPASSRNMVEQLGQRAAQFKGFVLDLPEVRAFIARDQVDAGFSDV